jgi:hypothetical protein
MPLVVGWAIRRAQAEVRVRKFGVPVFRQGFVPPPLPGVRDPAAAAAERAFADDVAAAAHGAAKQDSDADEGESAAYPHMGERARERPRSEAGDDDDDDDGYDPRNPINMID